jgi:hypothetical protein
MDNAVGDAPRLHRVGVVSHAKSEAIEIRAVEKFDVVCGGDRSFNLRGNNFSEPKQNGINGETK